LLSRLIQATAGKEVTVVPSTNPSSFPKSPGRPPFSHSYATCSKEANQAWRIKETLGMEHPGYSKRRKNPDLGLDKIPAKADIVVFDIANYGFWDRRDLWPPTLEKPDKRTWLLMKLTGPRFDEPDKWKQIWKVAEAFEKRSVVVVTVNDLRTQGMRVSRALSWESSVGDLVRVSERVLEHIPCAYLVVSFFTEGAIVLSNHGPDEGQIHLYYDPKSMEEGWQKNYPGRMSGHTFCLVAGIAQQMLQSADSTNDISAQRIGRGVQAGLAAQRYLHLVGFNVGRKQSVPSAEEFLDNLRLTGFRRNVEEGLRLPPRTTFLAHLRSIEVEVKKSKTISAKSLEKELTFPIAQVAYALKAVNNNLRSKKKLQDDENGPGPFLDVRVDNAVGNKGWTILDVAHEGKDDVLKKLAKHIVSCGLGDEEIYNKLRAPIREFGRVEGGKLTTIHRNEIESLTQISSLIEEYVGRPKQRTPLSIAVFGTPGSGKSFAIRAVAESLTGDGKPTDLTFNLSQFTSPDSIVNALHQVRDVALSGSVPLVFWDEFDTELGGKSLGWLRYFLAPMEDGKFQEGPVTHNIGQAVFVFAGGTSHSMDEFKKHALSAAPEVKSKDFTSRLKGYVDIAPLDHPGSGLFLGYKRDVVLRRALLLRAALLRAARTLLEDRDPGPRKYIDIDSGVLDAFMLVSRYKYGARSMESIVRMSMFTGKKMFERSSLPPASQLELHVNAKEFLNLVDAHRTDWTFS
jgi:hypothetical protein